MRDEIQWGLPVKWDDKTILSPGKEGERKAIMGGPWGSFSIIFRGGAWSWDFQVPKCVYGVDPCPALTLRFRDMDEAVRKWLEERK